MPEDVREIFGKQRFLPMATSNLSGKPNVVFVGSARVLDSETLLVIDNYLNKTRRNLEENPWVALVAFDIESKKSFQIKCSVTIETSGKRFIEEKKRAIAQKGGVCKAVMVLHVKEVYDASGKFSTNPGKRIA